MFNPADIATLIQEAGLPLVVVRCNGDEVSEIVLDKTATKAQYDQAYQIAKGYKPPQEEQVDIPGLLKAINARLKNLEAKVK